MAMAIMAVGPPSGLPRSPRSPRMPHSQPVPDKTDSSKTERAHRTLPAMLPMNHIGGRGLNVGGGRDTIADERVQSHHILAG